MTWNPKNFILTTMGAIYGGPGLLFLYRGQWGFALWGIGVGLLCIWLMNEKIIESWRNKNED